jgi:hypothetical protein
MPKPKRKQQVMLEDEFQTQGTTGEESEGPEEVQANSVEIQRLRDVYENTAEIKPRKRQPRKQRVIPESDGEDDDELLDLSELQRLATSTSAKDTKDTTEESEIQTHAAAPASRKM